MAEDAGVCINSKERRLQTRYADSSGMEEGEERLERIASWKMSDERSSEVRDAKTSLAWPGLRWDWTSGGTTIYGAEGW
jgi:hypothetical protein